MLSGLQLSPPSSAKPGIYLEDLYVQSAHRGKGLGKGFLKYLATLAVESKSAAASNGRSPNGTALHRLLQIARAPSHLPSGTSCDLPATRSNLSAGSENPPYARNTAPNFFPISTDADTIVTTSSIIANTPNAHAFRTFSGPLVSVASA